jgi:peptide/nickel transport system substrate-binding protein
MGHEGQPWESAVTRRSLIVRAVGGGVALTALGACGGGGTATTKTNAPPVKTRKGGMLRIGVSGGGAQDTLDAHKGTTDADYARITQLYDRLTEYDRENKLRLALAEELTPAKGATSWTVRLREGVTFHDGKPLTADDLIYSLQRISDPKDPKNAASSLTLVDFSGMRKLDDRTVRIPMKGPMVDFPDQMTRLTAAIVPRGYDPKKPIGTGPFKFESLSPGQQSVFTRNPSYWRDGGAHVDGVTIINFADDTGRVDALLGGQVEAITNLPAAQISAIGANSALKVLNSKTGAWQPFTMRVDKAPFDDVRVRQAFRLMVDREQMVKQVLSGNGTVGNDLYARNDPAYASDLPQRAQDLAQAKSLLKQAGREGLSIELVTAPVFQGAVEGAQVFAQQAKGAGVNVKIRKLDSATFYGPNYLKWVFSQDFWYSNYYLVQAAQATMPGAAYNETHWADPRWTKLVQQARGEVDDARRKELLHEAQKIEYDEGGYIVWSFSNQIDAASAKVTGFETSANGIPLTDYGFRSVQFAA